MLASVIMQQRVDLLQLDIIAKVRSEVVENAACDNRPPNAVVALHCQCRQKNPKPPLQASEGTFDDASRLCMYSVVALLSVRVVASQRVRNHHNLT